MINETYFNYMDPIPVSSVPQHTLPFMQPMKIRDEKLDDTNSTTSSQQSYYIDAHQSHIGATPCVILTCTEIKSGD
jgi:hypothetical protein